MPEPVTPHRPVVERRWPNGLIVCLASGPSLTASDVDFVRGKADAVICVNDTVRLAPWADVLYSSDHRWFKFHKGVPSFTGLKYGIESRRGIASLLKPYPDITTLRNTGQREIEFHPSGLRTGDNSGYAAVNLAVHFGAKRIVLLGYDMGISGSRTHFFGEHPSTLRASSPFERFRKLFGTMVTPLKAAGIDIVNCSRHTELKSITRAPLASVFSAREVAA